MKLDHECVRDFLLEFEDKGPAFKYTHISDMQNYDSFKNYGESAIVYTIAKLIEAEFLSGIVEWDEYSGDLSTCEVTAITFKGHEFIDTVRDSTVWSATKSAVSALTSSSISTLMGIGKAYTLRKIEEKTGLHLSGF